ncbi:MAG: hypothetical protein ACE5ED_05590 [Rhodothalassiaceae bacterium]
MAAAIQARSLATHVCAIMATFAASVPLPGLAEPLDLQDVIIRSGPHPGGVFRHNLAVGVTLRLPLDGGLAPDARRARVGLGLAMQQGYGAGGGFTAGRSMRLSQDALSRGIPILSLEFRVNAPGDPVLNGLALSEWGRLYAEETGAEEDEGGSNALWWILGGVGLAAGAGIAIGASASKTGKQVGDALSHALCKALGGTNCPPPENGG